MQRNLADETLMYQEDLDQFQCTNPKCTEKHGGAIIVCPDHEDSGVEVNYAHGIANLTCFKCNKLLARIAVAELALEQVMLEEAQDIALSEARGVMH